MGRAQGIAKDQFTGIVGERRGVKADQEGLSTAPPALSGFQVMSNKARKEAAFGTNKETKERRMAVILWMIECTSFPAVIAYVSAHCPAYQESLCSTPVETCREDLDFLAAQGVCVSSTDKNGDATYQVVAHAFWPENNQEQFAAWKENLFSDPEESWM